MNEYRYSASEVDAIVARNRTLTASEHRKYTGIGFLIGVLFVGAAWILL